MADVDKILNTPPGQALTNEDQDIGNPLAELDPIFAAPIGASPDAGKPTTTKQPYDYTPEVVGGAAGALVGLRAPKYENPKLVDARANLASAKAIEGGINSDLIKSTGSRLDAMDAARLASQDAQAAVSSTRQALSQAEANAAKYAVPDKAPLPIIDAAEDVAKGTSTAKGALTQGALRHSEKMGEITEANTVRKGIAGSSKGLPTSERVPLTGYSQSSRLIVPTELANAPVASAAQTEAEKAVQAAKEAHAEAVKRAAAVKVQQDALSKPTKAENTKTEALSKAKNTSLGAKATVDELTKARSLLSKIPGFNMIMGGLSGAELVYAYRQFEAGNTVDAVIAGLSGVGGLISLAPHPAAKLVGTAMTVPGMAYQGYQEAKERGFEMPTVKPMGN